MIVTVLWNENIDRVEVLASDIRPTADGGTETANLVAKYNVAHHPSLKELKKLTTELLEGAYKPDPKPKPAEEKT